MAEVLHDMAVKNCLHASHVYMCRVGTGPRPNPWNEEEDNGTKKLNVRIK